MSLSQFHVVLTVALLLPVSAVPFAVTSRQSVNRDSASVTSNPPEATVHVGQTQTFEAVVKGTHATGIRSEEHTSELQSRLHLVCRLLLEKQTTVPPASASFGCSGCS